jgi:hypothetical protein
MPAAPRIDEPGLSKREEVTVSTAAMSSAPWTGAAVTGSVVTLGDLGLHLIGGSIGLHALSGSVSLGAVAFFAVAAAGALLSSRSGRALRWARANPWRFALVPGVAVAAIAFVLSVVLGGGIFSSVFAALWHGAGAWALTGIASAAGGTRRKNRGAGA